MIYHRRELISTICDNRGIRYHTFVAVDVRLRLWITSATFLMLYLVVFGCRARDTARAEDNTVQHCPFVALSQVTGL